MSEVNVPKDLRSNCEAHIGQTVALVEAFQLFRLYTCPWCRIAALEAEREQYLVLAHDLSAQYDEIMALAVEHGLVPPHEVDP